MIVMAYGNDATRFQTVCSRFRKTKNVDAAGVSSTMAIIRFEFEGNERPQHYSSYTGSELP